MDEFIHIDKTFDKVMFFDKKITGREFDGCRFNNCDFSNTTFSECVLSDCEFTDCNLSNVKFPGTSLKTVAYKKCKLLGIRFDECHDFLFSVTFNECVLDYSWFSNKKMPKTTFENCSLKEVNFANADLSKAVFANCNLQGTLFDATVLKETDFRTAYNFTIDPENNPMKNARFSTEGLSGLLNKYDIKIV
ncbi:MAG TPA: pentapeptide repeat-containing protein [Flavobacterium sp.]|nr:pentapeptide repeat-containing protein [Flavobacterium sp.]